ncbi:dCTP deaminase domain-containing protein [Cochlodiniinecator piscidefendens]|uniref:dCTP deaminase domain-containing protein n=1 Tax=Cochlodiniinecator piscidefendens TaxID=2715756 RepID=UPI001409EDA8|nr:hypothetical protein [Cochlodiniinecator piscidefendens]
MGHLIVGESIISQKLIKNGNPDCIKHSTYDLTIGAIFPAGEKNTQIDPNEIYYLKPKQAILVLSHEEFGLPGTVTGIATLRTTLTKNGLLALNVGIIDPFFNGPISTTLINFSSRDVPIQIGMPFFRVVFFEHTDTTDFHRADESKKQSDYHSELQIAAYREFPKNFMDMPIMDHRFYAGTALKMIKGLAIVYWYFSIPLFLFFLSIVNYIIQNEQYWKYTGDTFKWLKETIPFF